MTSIPQAEKALIFCPDSSTIPLLLLLYSLGGSEVHEQVLFKGLTLQRRWDHRGNVQSIGLRDSGIRFELLSLFATQEKFMEVIKYCLFWYNIKVFVEGWSVGVLT